MDYGFRFYDPAIARFTTIDPLAEDYTFQSPYAYAVNNPILYIDIMGLGVEGDFVKDGKIIGTDGKKDNLLHVVNDQKSVDLITANDKNGGTTQTNEVSVSYSTSVSTLAESLSVLKREDGYLEESSVVEPNGNVTRGVKGNSPTGNVIDAELPYVPGNDNTSIHSHPTKIIKGSTSSGDIGYDAEQPGPKDPPTFTRYSQNVIVGKLGKPFDVNTGATLPRNKGAAFFDRNSNLQGTMTKGEMKRIVRQVKKRK